MKKRSFKTIFAAALSLLLLTGCGSRVADAVKTGPDGSLSSQEKLLKATYLGIENYGAPETNKDNIDNFRYRFLIGGTEKVCSVDNRNDYELQNQLKEGYTYEITMSGDIVSYVKELKDNKEPYVPPVSGTPGERTLKNFLKTAMEPVGTTLYIYGGGWDWQDEGSSIQTRTIGVSQDWVDFFRSNDATFTYKNTDAAKSYYPFGKYNEYYYAGLDCSAYVAWSLYNTFETENGKEGYVGGSTGFAKRLSGKGWGSFSQDMGSFVFHPGDIMSINGHVWISLGTCDDGSVLVAHSTPTNSRAGYPGGGVQLSAVGNSKSCEAYGLASEYMKNYFPEWSARYEAALKAPGDYFTFEGENAGLFSWDVSGAAGGLIDPDGMQNMTPGEALSFIFE